MESIEEHLANPLNYDPIFGKIEHRLNELVQSGQITVLERYGFYYDRNGIHAGGKLFPLDSADGQGV